MLIFPPYSTKKMIIFKIIILLLALTGNMCYHKKMIPGKSADYFDQWVISKKDCIMTSNEIKII